MLHKKIFMVFIAISIVSLLLYQRDQMSWTVQAFKFRHPALRSRPAPGLKPKHTNIVFLKTHKTGSSTMQNLLFRFAERNNLTVAMPTEKCGHHFCYPRSFTSRFVHPHMLQPNIIASHLRFNKTELQRLMPNDTIYITIMREPGSMFESMFGFMWFCKSFNRVPNGSLETFLKEPQRYYRPNDKHAAYAHNSLTFDLDGDKDRPVTDAAYARAFVAEVERVFSLVMITEYFDESLVLLRHLLSWDLDDIAYVKQNMRTPSAKKSLTPSLSAKIRAWNSLDARLYDHFNASLWRQLSALGTAYVEKEVRLLRQAQERLMRNCFGGRMPVLREAAEIKNKDLRPLRDQTKVKIMGYDLPVNLNRGLSTQAQKLCLELLMPEVQYTWALRRSQSQRYLQSKQRRPPQKSRRLKQPIRTFLPRHPRVHRRQPPPPAAPGPASGTRTNSTS